MITPRTTRLVRTADLATFRQALVTLACEGAPLDARDRMVIVPTHAAAAHLTRTIENRLVGEGGALVLPDLVTRSELVACFADRTATDRPQLSDAEREVLLGVAGRDATASGIAPPFRVRPAIVAEMLRFYDTLRRNQKDVDTFERLALGLLEPGAVDDRGAARLVAQTRFLSAAYRAFERRCSAEGLDEHALLAHVLQTPASRPIRHVVVAVGDRAFDANGLFPSDWDLLARVPGLERVDVVITDGMLAGAPHERVHSMLPGIEEVYFEPVQSSPPSLLTYGGSTVYVARDREEEVAAFARQVKAAARAGQLAALDRAALVVHRPLPYVYLTREVLRSAGVAYEMFDTLPLAGEPFAAALDLVFAFVDSGFSRTSAAALLRSPHFKFGIDGRVSAADVAALDRALSEAGYLGEVAALEALIEKWRAASPTRGHLLRAMRAADVARELARALDPLRTPAPAARHLDLLLEFVRANEHLPAHDDPLRSRRLRARGAILGTLHALRDAYARFDDAAVDFDEITALVRRWIEAQTFAPRVGDAGVHLVDSVSARFGDFESVQLAGLVDGEWPERQRRSIFYSAAVLRELGWPPESDRLDAERASFRDLMRLPSRTVALSTFSLEADALVSPSALVDEAVAARVEAIEAPLPSACIFEFEALALSPPAVAHLADEARIWAEWRLSGSDVGQRPGRTESHSVEALSLSAMERYQDCPFKFFASDVLRLEEAPDDQSTLSPRARGRLVHEVFQQFFAAWDARGEGPITSDKLEQARRLFLEVAEPLLARLPEADAVLERTRFFGSAINVGVADVVLRLEASHPVEVIERWLERRLEGTFTLGGSRAIPIRGVADRIDLIGGSRLRVIDYKSGSAPNPRRALQVPIYALCAQERLTERDGVPWTIDEAAYVAFSGKRSFVPVVKAGAADTRQVLEDARDRVDAVLAGIDAGEFPPRPYDVAICRYCDYSTVCRKDSVEDE